MTFAHSRVASRSFSIEQSFASKVCEDAGTDEVRFVTSAARRNLECSEW